MKSKRIIGITGSIATGKSTVSNIVKEMGYEVVDADIITHELMEIGEVNYEAIVKHFGEEILDIDRKIDRKKLASIVFNDEMKLKELNNLTHNNIFNKMKEIIKSSNNEIIFADIALLVELIIRSEEYNSIIGIDFDEIWLVYTDKKTQIKRLMKRNNISRDEALKLIESQMDIEEKTNYADYIIDNNGNIEDLRKQVIEKLRTL